MLAKLLFVNAELTSTQVQTLVAEKTTHCLHLQQELLNSAATVAVALSTFFRVFNSKTYQPLLKEAGPLGHRLFYLPENEEF
jgi:hypothetical protein